MDPVGHTSTQQAQPTNGQCTDDKRVKPSPQIKPFLQLLSQDTECRKNLIDRLIHEHNTLCSNPGDKIHTTQPPFSATHPQLAQWINTTFSGISMQGMYFIAFALGGYAEYHALATSVHRRGNTDKVNTQFIEDWFERYGTVACIKNLLRLSDTFGNIGEWNYRYRDDINHFCSWATTLNTIKSDFKPITGTKKECHRATNSYVAASVIFSDLHLDFTGPLMGFNYYSAMQAFDAKRTQSEAMKEQYSNSNILNAVMETIDNYIRTKSQDSNLDKILRSCFQKWVQDEYYKDIIKRFDNALKYP